MQRFATVTGLFILLAGPAQSDTWTCRVPYDEVNGGGTATVQEDRMTFRSNWSHRALETANCLRAGLISECMSATLSETKQGGASVFAKLYTIAWTPDGAPEEITTRQVSAIFQAPDDDYTLRDAFSTIAYSFPPIDCIRE